MCRYLMTDQFLGVTFANLIKRNIFNIEFSKLRRIEKIVDQNLRRSYNTILCVTKRDIYSAIDEYNDFFSANQDNIMLKNELAEKLEENILSRDEFIYKLDRYFTMGIPRDINSVVARIIEQCIEEQ